VRRFRHQYLRLKRILRQLARSEASARNLAWGAFVGFFVGMLPIMGIQMAVAVAVAALFRVSKLAAVLPVWITNPVTFVPIYGFNYWVGHRVTGLGPGWREYETILKNALDLLSVSAPDAGFLANIWRNFLAATQMLFQHGWNAAIALTIGCVIAGVVLGAAALPLVYYGVKRARARRAARRALLSGLFLGLFLGAGLPEWTRAAEADFFRANAGGNPPINIADRVPYGEEVTYQIRWNGFPAGVIRGRTWAKPRAVNGKPAAVFEIAVQANDFAALFFQLSATLRSFVDLDTGASLLFARRSREKNYQANDRVLFHYDRQNRRGQNEPVATVEELRDETLIQRETLKIPGYVCDPAGLAWYLRFIALKAGENVAVKVCDRYWTAKINLQVTQEEVIVVPDFGKVRCLKIVPEIPEVSGVVVNGLWVDQESHIVMRAWLRCPFGEITVQRLRK
jgi:uncharacterized protein (DUF2062 family)